MNQTRKYRYIALTMILVAVFTVVSQSVIAQPPPPPPPTNPPAGVPVDGGVVILISACLSYAWYKFKK